MKHCFNIKNIETILVENKSFTLGINTVKDKLSISIGDNYVFLDMVDEKYKFKSYGKINEISKPKIINKLDKKSIATTPSKTVETKPVKRFTIKGEIIDELDNVYLDDILYSLLQVESYSKPENHFKHQLTQLNTNDYKTIVNKLIYISRTVFGKVANSLPKAYRLEFNLLAIQKFNTTNLKEIEYIKLLELLQEYIEDKIFAKGKLLIQTDDLINKNLSDIVPINEIGFYEKNSEGKIIKDSIHKQAEIFRELFEVGDNNNLFDKIKKTINENTEIEKRFNELFKRKSFPLI